jgi:NurA-like 5'-3' nuclease
LNTKYFLSDLFINELNINDIPNLFFINILCISNPAPLIFIALFILYKSKKEKLEKIEIGVLVSEIENYQNKIQETEESLRQIEVSTVMHNAQMLTLENAIKELKEYICLIHCRRL